MVTAVPVNALEKCSAITTRVGTTLLLFGK
jgi:hypothetical protein